MDNLITAVVASDGRVIHTEQSGVFRRSNRYNELVALLNFPSDSAVKVNFLRPDGVKPNSQYMAYIGRQTYEGTEYSAYNYFLTDFQLLAMGPLVVSLDIRNGEATATSGDFTIDVEASEGEANDPAPTDPNQFDEVVQSLLRTDARLSDRTANVPNLVASIQKVASNAFTYTNNSGVESAPVVLENDETAPMTHMAAGVVNIPESAWQPAYADDGTTITGYTYTVTAGLHGQMKDGATANDLWVSFDEKSTNGFEGAYEGYTVDEAGNISLSVNKPVDMTVRVWNGKGIQGDGVDYTAREQIAAETERAETEEAHLQQQITELQNNGVDTTARQQIAAEIQRAETAENDLQTQITAAGEDISNLNTQLEGKANTSGAYPDLTVGQATALATPRNIDGVNFDGTANIVHYAACSTAASTGTKQITLPGFTLTAGARIAVRFTNGNTAHNVYLQINSGTLHSVRADGSDLDINDHFSWTAGTVVDFIYDGTYWYLPTSNALLTLNGTATNTTVARFYAPDTWQPAGQVVVSAGDRQPLAYRNPDTYVTLYNTTSVSTGTKTLAQAITNFKRLSVMIGGTDWHFSTVVPATELMAYNTASNKFGLSETTKDMFFYVSGASAIYITGVADRVTKFRINGYYI